MSYRVRCKRRQRNEWRWLNIDIDVYLRWLETGKGPCNGVVQSAETRRRAWPAVSRKDAEREEADRDAYRADLWQNDYEEYTEMVEDGYRAAGLL